MCGARRFRSPLILLLSFIPACYFGSVKKNVATKNVATAHSARTGPFIAKPLGRGKAEAFSQVEGLALSARSAGTLSELEGQGLTGDALRSAIAGAFAAKRGR